MDLMGVEPASLITAIAVCGVWPMAGGLQLLPRHPHIGNAPQAVAHELAQDKDAHTTARSSDKERVRLAVSDRAPKRRPL